MTQAQFTLLDQAICSTAKHQDFHLVYIFAALAYGLAQTASLTASAQLQDLASRAGSFI